MLENHIYHVYNRGNNRQTIFFSRENYLFFLKKVRSHLLPVCEMLAYCLMPNHFHFLVKTDGRSVAQAARSNRDIAITAFSRGMRTLLSSYAQAIQKQENRSGSLFQQKTKYKQVSSEWSWEDYTLVCFRYILRNPVSAGIVPHPADWEFSSYRDLAGLREGTLCNKQLIYSELSLNLNTLDEVLDVPLEPWELEKIW